MKCRSLGNTGPSSPCGSPRNTSAKKRGFKSQRGSSILDLDMTLPPPLTNHDEEPLIIPQKSTRTSIGEPKLCTKERAYTPKRAKQQTPTTLAPSSGRLSKTSAVKTRTSKDLSAVVDLTETQQPPAPKLSSEIL